MDETLGSSNDSPPELTVKAVLVGVVVGVVFGAANAYLGLKVGLTVSASIPAAVMAIAVFRVLGSRSVLECNMVQTIGSAGESLAAGVIFTVPVLFIWGAEASLLRIFLLSALGGVLGVAFMVPMRRLLIVKEHGKLPYPEGTACAEVLRAGEQGGASARLVFGGAAVGAVYKLLMSGFEVWKEAVTWQAHRLKVMIGMDAVPSLLGVGYIIGPRISAVMLAGGVLGWLVYIPLIALFGETAARVVAPGTVPIAEMAPGDIWHNYIRYIGAGGVAFGGIVTLVRALPTIWRSITASFNELTAQVPSGQASKRTDRDLPLPAIALAAVAVAFLAWRFLPVGPAGAALALVFSFFFVTVSSRIVGLVGSSSNPASGMTITSLLAISAALFWLGYGEQVGKLAAISAGSLVCIAVCIAGDTSQDLKTGYLVGATPRHQQIGEFVGVISSAIFIGLTLHLLNEAYGIGPTGELTAPQATLMSMVIDGVFGGSLPWGLIFIGMCTSAVVELCGAPSLPFAVGLYLPVSLTTPIMAGGVIRWAATRTATTKGDGSDRSGILYSSGLIAGEALCAIVLAVFAWREVDLAFASGCIGQYEGVGTLAVFAVVLVGGLWWVTGRRCQGTG